MTNLADVPLALPCVVKVGFAGSRRLLDPSPQDNALLERMQTDLTERMKGLPAVLGLSSAHFLCGVSQIAIGADTLFTRACGELFMPQWIFLPQPREEYLAAVGSHKTPDFSEQEQQTARTLLESKHVIHEQVVSNAPDRESRFEDTNLEILRISDVVVCLLRADAQTNKPGGTQHLLDLARKRGVPTLELRVGCKEGQVDLVATWHNQQRFKAPQLPSEVRDAALPSTAGEPGLPSIDEYRQTLKTFASAKAKEHQKLFRYAAFWIIGTHLSATLLAVFVLAWHGSHAAGSDAAHAGSLLTLGLLIGELLLIGTGFAIHQYLHRTHAAKVWAFSRLVAEITRSIGALGNPHLYLEYLFRLPMPITLQPLLRTLSVLYLRSTRPFRDAALRYDDWAPMRDAYLKKRLDEPPDGQIPYYTRELAQDQRRLRRASRWFVGCSAVALLATALKLAISLSASASEALPRLPGFLGLLAIVLPVIAVGALSYTAAMDSAARAHTYEETLAFLHQQRLHLEQAASFREFAALLLETENRLLGETANWYSRRFFTNVS